MMAISLEKIHQYLKQSGWTFSIFLPNLCKIIKEIEGEETVLIIPYTINLRDYEYRISLLIKALAIIEETSAEKIVEKIG